MGIAALVLGISSVVCGIFGFVWGGIVLGAVGIVLGALSRRDYGGGMATAGFVLSIIGAAISVLYMIAAVALVAWLGKIFGSIF